MYSRFFALLRGSECLIDALGGWIIPVSDQLPACVIERAVVVFAVVPDLPGVLLEILDLAGRERSANALVELVPSDAAHPSSVQIDRCLADVLKLDCLGAFIDANDLHRIIGASVGSIWQLLKDGAGGAVSARISLPSSPGSTL